MSIVLAIFLLLVSIYFLVMMFVSSTSNGKNRTNMGRDRGNIPNIPRPAPQPQPQPPPPPPPIKNNLIGNVVLLKKVVKLDSIEDRLKAIEKEEENG